MIPEIFFSFCLIFFGWGRMEEKKRVYGIGKKVYARGNCCMGLHFVCMRRYFYWGGGFRIFLRCCFVYFFKYLWIYIYPGANICSVENGRL